MSIPNVARMYDYLLGGKDNFAADRAAAGKLAELVPDIMGITRDSRAFLSRAVRFLAEEAGVRQFLDLGTGLPTRANVHEVASGAAPESRVVYVDYDPVVCAHARAILETSPGVGVVQADLREPERVLDDPVTRKLLDLSQPVGVLAIASLHFVSDADGAHDIVAAYRDRIAPGSYLAVVHVSESAPEDDPEHVVERAKSVFSESSAGLHPRTPDEIARFFDGFEILDPGVTWMADWRPEPGTRPAGRLESLRAAVGRKR